jgi:hypothetical protein
LPMTTVTHKEQGAAAGTSYPTWLRIDGHAR